MLPKKFKENYLTQQMAMKIGRKTDMNLFYYPEECDKFIRTNLWMIIEQESGRSMLDCKKLTDSLDLKEFILKCKKFSK